MSRKPRTTRADGRDRVEINVTGNQNAVATHGGQASITLSQAATEEWAAWRDRMAAEIQKLAELAAEDKAMLVQQVDQVVAEAQKGDAANPGRIEKLLNTLTIMAPDILDVIITTIGSPLAGLGLVVKKIGDRAAVVPAQ